MPYALRNTFILVFLLVVVAGGGFYWIGVRQVKRIEALQAQQERLDAELEEVNYALSLYDTTVVRLENLKASWRSRKQFVPEVDTPDRTLAYLDRLLRQAGEQMNFDFLYRGRVDSTGYSVHVYGLEGEGQFENLYAFLWHLEHGLRFYTVDRLQIDYQEPTGELYEEKEEALWVRFRMVLRAYFTPRRAEMRPPSPGEPGRPLQIAGNPFIPLITRGLPENTLGLLEVEGARLIALTHDRAYLVDGKGEMHVLREADRIYLGWLDRIDIFANRAEFVLNKGGIWERVTLKVESDTAQKVNRRK